MKAKITDKLYTEGGYTGTPCLEQLEALMQVAEMLIDVPTRQFDAKHWGVRDARTGAPDCGTTACVGGWIVCRLPHLRLGFMGAHDNESGGNRSLEPIYGYYGSMEGLAIRFGLFEQDIESIFFDLSNYADKYSILDTILSIHQERDATHAFAQRRADVRAKSKRLQAEPT